MSVEAGLDMSMTPSDYDFAVYLAELVREGIIPESRIDESVRRILKLKEDLGLFDNAYPDTAAPELVATEASREAARLAARESITLLSNDGVRSEEHTSELQSRGHLVCRLLLEKKKELRRVLVGRDTVK